MTPDILHVVEVPSTMELAHSQAHAGARHGTAIRADRQTAGRGTRGRQWSAETGGLWLSVVARPERTDALEALSLRVGLAVAALLERHYPALPQIGLKWPNDLILDGRKFGGILCEARWSGATCQWVIVGLGLNLSNPIPDTLTAAATRLADWGVVATPEELAWPCVGAIARATHGAGPLSKAELNAFAARDFLIGRDLRDPTPGTAEGITASGALRVRTESGPVREILGGVVTTTG